MSLSLLYTLKQKTKTMQNETQIQELDPNNYVKETIKENTQETSTITVTIQPDTGTDGTQQLKIGYQTTKCHGRTYQEIIESLAIVMDHLIKEQTRIYGTENRVQLAKSKETQTEQE